MLELQVIDRFRCPKLSNQDIYAKDVVKEQDNCFHNKVQICLYNSTTTIE